MIHMPNTYIPRASTMCLLRHDSTSKVFMLCSISFKTKVQNQPQGAIQVFALKPQKIVVFNYIIQSRKHFGLQRDKKLLKNSIYTNYSSKNINQKIHQECLVAIQAHQITLSSSQDVKKEKHIYFAGLHSVNCKIGTSLNS